MTDLQIILPNLLDSEDKSSDLANCIRKSYRHLKKWAKRTNTDCFRLYDREINHYPLAIDVYAGRYCIHYFSKSKDEEEAPEALEEEIEGILNQLFGAEKEDIYWRTRRKSKVTRQYEKVAAIQEYFTAYEYGVKFTINLTDYLDTGLFLDHRETRQAVSNECKDKRVLNLFAYTCSFSVHAATKGARFTKSVDMSNTYCEWGRENFNLNNLPQSNHPIIRADCLRFLEDEVRDRINYDIIIIDPPTISRSKKMDQLFDIQEDYRYLINQSLKLLTNDGLIFFSTNSRKFVFDENEFPGCGIKEISHKTLPIDFKDKKIHRCWTIKRL